MATPLLLQKARQRKIIYWAAIAVLLTVSLVHRELLLKPMAYSLQLQESARGEVKLTSSAVRLLLTGSRGLAVTMLWYNAMDKQKRSEWNELELLVASITELQPYFITPWLYQSWNISFNVAVECDRPRDKYYYISRGLELLSEGERRNRGTEDARNAPGENVFPGNPDMRYYMGFTYQLKIGTSDERLTMRSFLEMSCIDPVERNPDNFWTTNERNQKTVDLLKFARFTQKYPRLVRRLREQLGLSEPENVVKFLQDNKDIPNRFQPNPKATLANVRQSELKNPRQQFPIVPPPERNWPDPNKFEMTNESVDVFLLSRAWYEFAQKPLPPPNPFPGSRPEPDYDKMKYRVPKNMVIQLFRHYPPRAQVYIAETLESEGMIDGSGWVVEGWFDNLLEKHAGEFADADGNFRVATEAKYHSRLAWEKGYESYKNYGIANGMYLAPAEVVDLERQAAFAREQLHLNPGDMPTIKSDWRKGELKDSLEAHLRLRYSEYYRRLSNFDSWIDQSEGEMDPVTAAMRKALYHAERKRKRETPSEAMLALYDEAWSLYINAALGHRKFAQVGSMQEDLYETYLRYLGEAQNVRKKLFTETAVKSALIGAATATGWPSIYAQAGVVAEVSDRPAMLLKVIPIRQRRGYLDTIRYYDGPGARDLREFLFLWTEGAALAMSPDFTGTITYPGQPRYLLTASMSRDVPLEDGWRRLITDETHRISDQRVGLNR